MRLGRIHRGQSKVGDQQLHKRMGWQSIVQIVVGFVEHTISPIVTFQW